MNKRNYPFIALGLSVPLLALLLFGGQTAPDGSTRLPWLTLLAVSEFGAIANIVAAWLTVPALTPREFDRRRAAAAAAAIVFAGIFIWSLVRFWPF